MDREWTKNTFEQDGYVLLRGFFDEDQTQEVRDNIIRYVQDVVPLMPREQVYYEVAGDRSTLKQLQMMHTYDPFFETLFLRSPLRDLAELLLNGEVTPKNMQYFNKPPGVGKPTPVHQDGYYFNIEPTEAITMWLALDEVNEENGCLRYVRGAHKYGVRPHRRTDTLGFSQGLIEYCDEDHQNEVTILASPGDLIAHHCLMIHRADGNASDRHRRALGFIYYSARVQENAEEVQAYQKNLIIDLKEKGEI